MQMTNDFENPNYVKKGIAHFTVTKGVNFSGLTTFPVFEIIKINDSQNIVKISNTQILLKANSKYKLKAEVYGSGSAPQYFYFYNVTAGTEVGDRGVGASVNANKSAEYITTPNVDTIIELRGLTAVFTTQDNFSTIIEELETYTIPTYNLQMLGIGIGQTWRNVIGSRALSTTYINTTGKPIVVNVTTVAVSPADCLLFIDNINVVRLNTVGATGTVTGIVPNGSSYKVTVPVSISVLEWFELR